MTEPDDERARTLALLESQHAFPGAYTFRVVVRPAHRTEVVTVISSVRDLSVQQVEEKASRKGSYLSVRVTARVERAEVVLDVYELMQGLASVLAVM